MGNTSGCSLSISKKSWAACGTIHRRRRRAVVCGWGVRSLLSKYPDTQVFAQHGHGTSDFRECNSPVLERKYTYPHTTYVPDCSGCVVGAYGEDCKTCKRGFEDSDGNDTPNELCDVCKFGFESSNGIENGLCDVCQRGRGSSNGVENDLCDECKPNFVDSDGDLVENELCDVCKLGWADAEGDVPPNDCSVCAAGWTDSDDNGTPNQLCDVCETNCRPAVVARPMWCGVPPPRRRRSADGRDDLVRHSSDDELQVLVSPLRGLGQARVGGDLVL